MARRIAIVGATGAVGRMFLQLMEERDTPVTELALLASARSLGKVLHFRHKPVRVQELTEKAAKRKFDFVLMSAGKGVSRKFAPVFAKAGSLVIDNSSAWRMDKGVPLVVPEVNPGEIRKHKGIIANPNCSTIQMVVVLKPIHDVAKIRRVVVATYQAASGIGGKGLLEL
ncbi:MAG: aspartate-semialdehyde dehydrogenase, partial [Planctomycetota bacterium]